MFELCQEICGPNRVVVVLMGEAGASLLQVVSEEAIAAACGYQRGKASVCLLDTVTELEAFVADTDLLVLAGDLSMSDDLLDRALQIVKACTIKEVCCCLLPASTVTGMKEKERASQLINAVSHVLLSSSSDSSGQYTLEWLQEALLDLVYAVLGEGLILARLQDVFAVLDAGKYGCYATGIGRGENPALDAFSAAVRQWPCEPAYSWVLCSIRSGYDIRFAEIVNIGELFKSRLPPESCLITSSTIVEGMRSEIHIGLTGFSEHRFHHQSE